MDRWPRIRWAALLAEGAVIVSSILAAFALDAWWATQLAARRETGHLQALRRDFEIARGRVAESTEVARRGERESLELYLAILGGRTAELGRSVFESMRHTIGYEVFSAPRGAYDTLVGAGEVDLLQSTALKQALADFYGGFDDLRVSEQQLLRALLDFQQSPVFAHKVNFAEIGYTVMQPDAPLGERIRARVASWQGDDELGNWLCLLSTYHDVVAEDYAFLAERIDAILALLTAELADR